MQNDTVTVQVPASTSNCGPGFDTLGIALRLYNFVRVRKAGSAGEVRGLGPEPMPEESLEMARCALTGFREETGVEAHGLEFEIWGEVPIARGLGSSATLQAGLVAGLNRLHGEPLDRGGLTALACRLDHSPDNTCPVVNGGFCVARTDPETGRLLQVLRHPVEERLKFVVVSPESRVQTREARRILPPTLPLRDAVRSINSAAAVVSIFASGKYELLTDAVTDFIHEPYRERLNPFARECIRAGVGAGAYCGWLSGSGSSVLCVSAAEPAEGVGLAMAEIFARQGIPARMFKLSADNEGLRPV